MIDYVKPDERVPRLKKHRPTLWIVIGLLAVYGLVFWINSLGAVQFVIERSCGL